MSNLLAKGLTKIYNKRKVVNRQDLAISPGEVVGLLGPNGAGKTTTFYMIVGLIKPDGGEIFLDDEDISKDPMYKRARKGLNYLCLLYTSDAADEEDSVDLGGRRII